MMTRTVTAVRQYLAAAFLIAIGLIAYGCGDTGTVNPVVELASLTVSPGTLQPGFSGGNTQYRVQVTTDITSVRVTAQPAVAGDRVTINGQETTNRNIPLGEPGSTTPVSIVVSETDTNSRTYTVLVNRAGLTGNNSLGNLIVSPGTLAPAFNTNTQNYTVDVANNVQSITVTPTLSDPAATMTVNGQSAISGQTNTIPLNNPGQDTVIPIVVTAQNASPKTYLVTVNRGVSGNNNLRSLTVSPGSLNPSFSAGTEGYTVNVASTVASIVVTPTLQDTSATMRVNGQATNSGQARTIQLGAAGSNTPIFIIVTAQNGTQQTYTVGVNRAAPAGNNNLSGLTVSPGSLSPAFNAETEDYTVNVASTVADITVTPRLQDTAATMTVNGQPTNSGQTRTITLNGAGSNTVINIVVTAPNGSRNPYTVNVARAALGGNNNLSGLTVSPGTLNPSFSAGTENYTVNVASTVDSITVTPRLQDTAATMTVNGQSTNSGQARTVALNGAGSSTSINIVVTAPNGSRNTYTVNVNRAALGGNNNLSGLAVSPGSLSPAFNAETEAYTVNVASTVASITVTPRLQDTAATMTVNGQPTNSGQARTITLNGAGANTVINIVVTAPNGSRNPYTVNVARAAPASNNNLQSLTVSPGSLSPSFSAGTEDYTVNVASSVTSVTIFATKADPNAVMSGSVTAGAGVATGQASIPLDGAGTSTSVSITVTAPNGNSKTYSITINRAASEPTEPPAPGSAPDLISQDDSGLLPGQDSDNVTNVTTPRFRIPQPGSGETPSLYVDGNKVSTTFDSGANTLKPTAALSDGEHTITSTVTNGEGESPQSPSLTVTIDTVGPVFP